ncbi:uncharacterized protein LOC129148755 [Eptesicus fuscus]|uniref:uncharacterized protein LOC129148755 n=1 Tax=Eptesicus fuscus TaxID=29078 RepID=UPI0024046661|nr:uncharacterized protein LOC129148755 [Eptesicus fuscus]
MQATGFKLPLATYLVLPEAELAESLRGEGLMGVELRSKKPWQVRVPRPKKNRDAEPARPGFAAGRRRRRRAVALSPAELCGAGATRASEGGDQSEGQRGGVTAPLCGSFRVFISPPPLLPLFHVLGLGYQRVSAQQGTAELLAGAAGCGLAPPNAWQLSGVRTDDRTESVGEGCILWRFEEAGARAVALRSLLPGSQRLPGGVATFGACGSHSPGVLEGLTGSQKHG